VGAVAAEEAERAQGSVLEAVARAECPVVAERVRADLALAAEEPQERRVKSVVFGKAAAVQGVPEAD
jgi:hypothetical protein